jgi:hypothetical protein
MKTDMVKYYYKDLDTGVEVTFSKTAQFGWAVAFHVSKEEVFDMLISDIVLPWPELSEEDQKVVDANYDRLYKSLEGE